MRSALLDFQSKFLGAEKYRLGSAENGLGVLKNPATWLGRKRQVIKFITQIMRIIFVSR